MSIKRNAVKRKDAVNIAKYLEGSKKSLEGKTANTICKEINKETGIDCNEHNFKSICEDFGIELKLKNNRGTSIVKGEDRVVIVAECLKSLHDNEQILLPDPLLRRLTQVCNRVPADLLAGWREEETG